MSQFHLIGHSAGAHLVGAAGSAVSYGRIPRITGLEPAEASGTWDFNDTSTRLDLEDAEFVDIMHTNGGQDSGEIGFFEAMGHVDFYVNGGHYQPGCPPTNFCIISASSLIFNQSNYL